MYVSSTHRDQNKAPFFGECIISPRLHANGIAGKEEQLHWVLLGNACSSIPPLKFYCNIVLELSFRSLKGRPGFRFDLMFIPNEFSPVYNEEWRMNDKDEMP